MLREVVTVILADGTEHNALVLGLCEAPERVENHGTADATTVPAGPGPDQALNLVMVSPSDQDTAPFGLATRVLTNVPHESHRGTDGKGNPTLCWRPK